MPTRSLLAAILCAGLVVTVVAAQQQTESETPSGPRLPDDPRLLELHKDFVTRCEKLAKEYEREDDRSKARVCYEEILKLAPGYPRAETALARIRQAESTAQRRVVDVAANKGWQDTGVELIAGMPLAIKATGSWTFRVSHELSPDGIPIPEDLRDFNLGSLIGRVVEDDPADARPFLVGGGTEFVSEVSGRLYLCMYDSVHEDNSGKLHVEIQGTFDE